VSAMLELARIYTEKTRFLEASALIDRAIRLNPKNDGAQYLAGLNYRLMRDAGRAAPYLMNAVELRPDVAEYQFQLGLWHEDFRQYAPALDRFNQAVRIDPELAEAWYHLAVIHSRQREESAAFDSLQEAVRAGGDAIRKRAAGDTDFDIFRSAKDSPIWGRKFQRLIEK
jgi:tetratricopeptide (TPR) repeat protein